MDATTILWVVGGIALGGIIAWVIASRRAPALQEGDEKSFLLLQNQIDNLTRAIDQKLGESQRDLNTAIRSQFDQSQRLIQEITRELTSVKEVNRQVVDFADQLQNLQDVLQNPKQRGILGEYYLETVLQNVLPPGSYQMQYPFKNGEIVDAAVFVKDRIIPVDSKFSLENYNRAIESHDKAERERYEKAFKQDLKLRIDETSKYVRPEENTMEFAFMFIPSEGVYYDLLINQVGTMKTQTRDLIEYAFSKKVIIASPTSFLAYLQTVLQGLKALQIEEQAKDIQKRVGELGRHLGVYQQFLLKLGNSLSTTVSHYNSAQKEFGKIDKDVMRISGVSNEVETMLLERPDVGTERD
jgi:DNA recombination protein RmuC